MVQRGSAAAGFDKVVRKQTPLHCGFYCPKDVWFPGAGGQRGRWVVGSSSLGVFRNHGGVALYSVGTVGVGC